MTEKELNAFYEGNNDFREYVNNFRKSKEGMTVQQALRYQVVQLVAKEMKEIDMTISVLGTVYTIETHKISEDDFMKSNNLEGWCGENSKIIVVADYEEKEYFSDLTEYEKAQRRKNTLRHEIVHAFFNESGLSASSNQYQGAWTKNEEMIDWIAIQWHKINAVFEQLNI